MEKSHSKFQLLLMPTIIYQLFMHTPSGYSLFTNCSFDATRHKLDYYRGKDCIESFCKDLREKAIKITDYIKKK